MRFLIADGVTPFDDHGDVGAAERLADGLRATQHEVERVRLPTGHDPLRVALAARLTDVSDAGEVLVALGPPAHLLAHPRKVLWCEELEVAPLMAGEPAAADRAAFAEAARVIASSAALAERLSARFGVPVAVAGDDALTEILG